jgi:hypothetical protein
MLLVHADGMSLHMVVTWPGLLLCFVLVKHYAGSIVIHTQRGQGMSNLVFSDKLSLGDAINTPCFPIRTLKET